MIFIKTKLFDLRDVLWHDDVIMMSLLRITSCYNLSRTVTKLIVSPLLKAADEYGSFTALFNVPKYFWPHSLSLEVSNDPMISLWHHNLCDCLSKTINLSCDALVESSWWIEKFSSISLSRKGPTYKLNYLSFVQKQLSRGVLWKTCS